LEFKPLNHSVVEQFMHLRSRRGEDSTRRNGMRSTGNDQRRDVRELRRRARDSPCRDQQEEGNTEPHLAYTTIEFLDLKDGNRTTSSPQHDTMQSYSTAQHSTVQYSTVQHRTV
jgi:hypothetical protein